MPVSIDDIARLAGVSTPTVSKALSGRHHVNAETRQRIRELAQELNFVPSRAAQSLGRGRTGMIGIIYRRGALPDAISLSVLMGMDRILQSKNHHLVILTHDADDTEVPLILRQRFLDAVGIFHKRDIRDEAFLIENRIPHVVINAEPSADQDCVIPDNRGGMKLIVDHLAGLGHQRIAYVNTPTPRHFSASERVNGYVEAMTSERLPLMPGFNLHVDVGEQLDRLFSLQAPPTALVCFNDQIALESCSYLLDRGISVPGQVSVTGCDNATPLLTWFRPKLTTLQLPFESMGEQAAHMLLDRLEEPDRPATTVMLPMELVVRNSTAPAAGAAPAA